MAKKQRKTKKKKKDNRSYYSISAFVLIVILFITIFQLGVIGTYIDAFFAYLFGTSRYFTYLMLFLMSIYLAGEQKIPFTRRMGGYILLQFGMLFLFHTLLYLLDRARIEDFYTFSETVEAIEASGIMVFFGGGIIGQALFSFSSTGISMVGTLLLGLIFLYFSYLLITSKDIEQSISHDLIKASELMKQLGNALIKGLKEAGSQLAKLFSMISAKVSDRSRPAASGKACQEGTG